MTEGGGYAARENLDFDPRVYPDEWVQDDDEEQDPNETTPFVP